MIRLSWPLPPPVDANCGKTPRGLRIDISIGGPIWADEGLAALRNRCRNTSRSDVNCSRNPDYVCVEFDSAASTRSRRSPG